MPSIALIGPDGAGKTTITRMLTESGVLPFRYLYMGVSVPSSNLALPSSRLVEALKPRLRGGSRETRNSGTRSSATPSRRRKIASRAWGLARLGNRLAEEWFRQIVSWYYQFQGYTVLYDRHFVLDYAPEVVAPQTATSIDKRLHRWCLSHLYPRPDLVVYLDAPGEVLFARKGELTVEELERRRQAFLRVGKGLRNFVRVDATQPLEEVYREVTHHVVDFCNKKGMPRASGASSEPAGGTGAGGGPAFPSATRSTERDR